jgi:uncharacterized coiled-coil protein SlyX
MSDQRVDAVERTCLELAAAGEPVTFITIAARSGIPRVTLYRNPTLRALVEEHRARARQATTLSALAAELANQRLAIEALADRVRRHEEQLRKLHPKPKKK